jgi:uncharacterized paraquat-inducible protein A
MALNRSSDGSDPLRAERVAHVAGDEERRVARSSRLGEGTLACPECDAPVALPEARPVTPADALGCPYCGHDGAVRDFLSLAAPSRPARVVVRVVLPAPSAGAA